MEHAAVPGDVQRLEQWITQYADDILRICFIYLRNRSQAEDAMQDTFLKAWQHMRSVQDNNAKVWLMRIAVNTCHDYHRSKWFRHIDMKKALEDLPPQVMTALPQDHELLMDVYRLPEKQKQVILLYYYQNMTLKDVAECLSISCSAVHKRLQKAQQLLRCELERSDFDEK